MPSPPRLAMTGVLLLAAGQALLYLIYAGFSIADPFEFHALEGKMVHLAWRAQAGERLYPTWTDYPHVSNYYSPLYWRVVGWAGRLGNVGLDGLTSIGRGVNFGSTLLVSLTLGVAAGRRYGRIPGIVAALSSLGGSPLVGFSVMTRPDMMAEWLGLLGFFLATGRAKVWATLGVVALVSAILTKQTAGIYLLAAWVGLLVSGRPRNAWAVLGSGLGLLALVVLMVQFAIEPNFVPSLLGDSRTPWTLDTWSILLTRLIVKSPQVPALALTGLILWSLGPRSIRDSTFATLAAFSLLQGLVTTGKMGADLNYFLPMNAVSALAAAAFWKISTTEDRPNRLAITGLVLLGALLVPGFLHNARNAREAQRALWKLGQPEGQARARVYRELFALAEDPDQRILTDEVLIDIHQKKRTAFGDPYLFTIQVETGSIVPTRMLQSIEDGKYERIVTHHDLNAPDYRSSFPRLPMPLVEAARRSYRADGFESGFYFYRPLDSIKKAKSR